MLKLTVCLIAAAAAATTTQCAAFAPAFVRTSRASGSCAARSATPQVDTKRREGGVADELGIPCEGECTISKYPNLPESVHPGVLSGRALMDLLQDAKAKGTCQRGRLE
jgi:fructose-bisphosphate aldolase class II